MRFNSKRLGAGLAVLFSLLSLATVTFASGTAVAPTFVQFGGNLISSSTSPRPTFTSALTAGNLVACEYHQTTGTAATPVPGAPWVTATLDPLGKNGVFYMWVPSPAGTLPPIVTNNPAGGNSPHIACWEINGANEGTPIQQASIIRAPTTTRPASQLMTPSALQADIELGFVSVPGGTPSPSPSATPVTPVVTPWPTPTGNSGFFDMPMYSTYTGNSLPFGFIVGTASLTNTTFFVVDVMGNYACGQTQTLLAGVGC